MPIRSGACLVALLAASLGGCQAISGALGGSSGVMPDSEVGPPPSMRGAVPGKMSGTSRVDEDGNALPATPTRQLALPKTVRGDTRSADAGPRRINREEIDGGNASVGGSGSGGMAPALTPGGGVGVGGKF